MPTSPIRFSTRRASVARLYPVKSNARESFRWFRTSSRPAPSTTPSATFPLTARSSDRLGLDQSAEHIDALRHRVEVAPEPGRAHRPPARLCPSCHRLGQRNPVLERTERDPEGRLDIATLLVQEGLGAPGMTDPAAEPERLLILDLPQHTVAIRARPLGRPAG